MAQEMRSPEEIAHFMQMAIDQQANRERATIMVGDVVTVDNSDEKYMGYTPGEEYWVLEKKNKKYRIGKEGVSTAHEQWIDEEDLLLVE